jgi:HTH-type transcriptional regulator/antitoxin HigA
MTRAGIQVHPIRTESDHERAVARISELMSAAPGTPEGDELDVLATLVDAFEAKHHAMEAPDPVTAIQFRMEQQGLTRKDLEPLIGSRARVSEVLTRKRNLTLDMIRRVKLGLGISADLLIGATPIKARSLPVARATRNSRRRKAAEVKAVKQTKRNRRSFQ